MLSDRRRGLYDDEVFDDISFFDESDVGYGINDDDDIIFGSPDGYNIGDYVTCPECGKDKFVWSPNLEMWVCTSCDYRDVEYEYGKDIVEGGVLDVGFLDDFDDVNDNDVSNDISIIGSIRDGISDKVEESVKNLLDL